MSLIRAIIRLGIAATLVAGLVGAYRQRREAQAVRRGERPPAGVATLTVPPPNEGRLAAAIAAWVPERPRTMAGQVVAGAWAAPLSLVGLVFGSTSGARPRWVPEHGCLIFEGARGGSAVLLRTVGAGANAIGHVVVSRYERTPPLVLAHEAGHVRQAERLGVLLFPVYLWGSARYGYRDNPIERSARAAARRWQAMRAAASNDAAQPSAVGRSSGGDDATGSAVT